MNFNKDNKIFMITIISIFIVIISFFSISKLLFGDDRSFPVENIYQKKYTIDGYKFYINNMKFNSKNNILQIDLDFFIDDYDFSKNESDDNKKEFKVYYAEPKEEIQDFKYNYIASLKDYKKSETQKSKKINFLIQIPLTENIKNKLGLVFQFITSKKVWDEISQKSHYEESEKINIGIDYRDMKFTDFHVIKNKIMPLEVTDYIKSQQLLSNQDIKQYTSENQEIVKEDGGLSTEEQEQSLNNNIDILKGQLENKEEEINKIKEDIQKYDYDNKQLKVQNKIIENLENDKKDIQSKIDYYNGLEENISGNNND